MHLLRMTSGLESMIVGEDQILGQVKDAKHKAVKDHHCGKSLDAIFTKAIHVGQVVRNKTNINKGSVSIGSAAIDLAEKHQADIVKYKIHSLKHDAPCVYNSLKDFELNVEVISGKAQALNRYDISDYHVVDAVFKTSTIKENEVHFYTDLHLREDDAFMGAFYSVASQVVVTDLPLYNYYTSSYFSHTHSQSVERQRVLIQSGLLAIRYRKAFIATHCPNLFFPYERLKYMRWVCTIRNAISAKFTLKEYKALLNDFRKEGIYPLDYAWIKVAGWDYAFKPYMKRVLQTFMMNNPWLVWLPAKWYYNRRK